MRIKRIELNNFRNYTKADIDFHEKVNLILGENAQGKTNLLESIYLSSVGKSFRTARDKNLIKFSEDFCRIKTEYVRGEDEGTVEIAISKEGKKAAKLDGVMIERSSQLLDNIYTVVFSPEDLKVVKDDPEKRRSFMDRELCQLHTSYNNDLYVFKRVLAQRNALLKENMPDKKELAVWDENLAECGAGIITARENFIEEINILSRRIHEGITAGRENIEIIYDANIPAASGKSEQKEQIVRLLSENAENDIYNGNTGRGPHKDDLKILIDGKNVRQFGSQGQQRTAALSLKLAEIGLIRREKNEDPILLLDDVLSELDENRQKYLIDSLGKSQLFLTAASLPEGITAELPQGKIMKIKNGSVME